MGEWLYFNKRINDDRLCHRMLLFVEFDGIRYNDLMRVLSINCNLMEDASPRISKTGHVTRKNISLVVLDLSYNLLDSQIPTEIFAMQYLLPLNLENNHLMGSLPQELGGMASLIRLDLSHNMLEGNIPSSLSALSLSWLDLSNNQFGGPIPEQGSLVTFPEYSFENNSGLCATLYQQFHTEWRRIRISEIVDRSSVFSDLVDCTSVIVLYLFYHRPCNRSISVIDRYTSYNSACMNYIRISEVLNCSS